MCYCFVGRLQLEWDTLRSLYFALLPYVGDAENTVKMICNSGPFRWDLAGSTPQVDPNMDVSDNLPLKAFHVILSSSHQQLLKAVFEFPKYEAAVLSMPTYKLFSVISTISTWVIYLPQIVSLFYFFNFFSVCCYENLITCPLLWQTNTISIETDERTLP